MRRLFFLVPCTTAVLVLSSCSPRDFLTRRLAADLIVASDTFRATQQLQLRTGIVSNQDYFSTESLVLQHRGWISATQARCPADIAPPPCWDVSLTPSGVDTFRPLLPADEAGQQTFSIPAAKRELVAVTGISKLSRAADVEFICRWIPLNEVGAVLYSAEARYRSTAAFRCYDDGWRVVQGASHPSQPLDESLKNAEPVP